jgi:membrane protease YdiL (CAAX protease family)
VAAFGRGPRRWRAAEGLTSFGRPLRRTDLGWQFLGAIVLLVGFIYARQWRDLAFAPAHSVVRVMWFPAIWLALISAVLLLVGLPPGRMIAFIAVNTLLVGISEETMFRGVLFRALLTQYRVWTAIIVSSILFGAVYILNCLQHRRPGGRLCNRSPRG